MILGLTGLKESGKDTVGAYLIKEHNFERRASADVIKRSIGALFDIPPSDVDRLKSDPTVYVAIGYKNQPEEPTDRSVKYANHPLAHSIPSHMWSPIVEMTMRKFQQRYGTDSHRDVLGEDIWIDKSVPVGGYYNGRAIVVTDVRFQNEAQRVRDIGGKIIRIERPGLDIQDLHRNETELATIQADYVIDNSSSILDLYERTERMLTELGATT